MPAHDSHVPGSRDAWRHLLHRRLAGQATPVVSFPDGVRSAASLWAGTRQWTHALRAAGVRDGQRVMAALPGDAALLQLLLACLWDGLDLVVHPPTALADVLADDAARRGARLVIVETPGADGRLPWMHVPAPGGWPDESVPLLVRPAGDARADGAGLTDANGAGVSYDTLYTDLTSHPLCAELAGARVLAAGAWDDIGLIRDGVLLPLLVSEELLVVPLATPQRIRQCVADEPITHVLVEADEGSALAAGLAARVIPLRRAPSGC